MPLYAAMNYLKSNTPQSVSEAQAFLDSLPPLVQEQLICAIYLGRDHLNSSNLRVDVEISRTLTDHIDKDEYANILYQKGRVLAAYFANLEKCATASGFNLNNL